ncbi:hypothetical protein ASD06_08095 [Angustibacter sp. Root456]|nr:hypothetical protein ASD06_08095 [Angustibacter sp. Root456]
MLAKYARPSDSSTGSNLTTKSCLPSAASRSTSRSTCGDALDCSLRTSSPQSQSRIALMIASG